MKKSKWPGNKQSLSLIGSLLWSLVKASPLGIRSLDSQNLKVLSRETQTIPQVGVMVSRCIPTSTHWFPDLYSQAPYWGPNTIKWSCILEDSTYPCRVCFQVGTTAGPSQIFLMIPSGHRLLVDMVRIKIRGSHVHMPTATIPLLL